MSVFLLASSFVSVLLIPAEAFQPGQPADGRALAYLAHLYLGSGFGTMYDLVTIAILWFAGASAMAGLLNLVPLYLPRYGMAPEWARATRPLVVIFTCIGIIVTLIFSADVEAQAGAYATGVLVLITSGAVAVAIAAWRQNNRWPLFASITLVFVYTSVTNMIERPEGIKIASVFILSIVITSLVSRTLRSTELRVLGIQPDPLAEKFIDDASRGGEINIIANRPGAGDWKEYEDKLREARETHHLTPDDPVLFLEVERGDASEFSEVLLVKGARVHGFCVLRCKSPAIPNTIAALLLHIRDRTSKIPHVYFGWTEGNPVTLPAEVPGVRRGRHRPGDPRGPASGGSRPSAQAAGARRVESSDRWICYSGPKTTLDEPNIQSFKEIYAIHANHQVAAGREEAIRNQLAV